MLALTLTLTLTLTLNLTSTLTQFLTLTLPIRLTLAVNSGASELTDKYRKENLLVIAWRVRERSHVGHRHR